MTKSSMGQMSAPDRVRKLVNGFGRTQQLKGAPSALEASNLNTEILSRLINIENILLVLQATIQEVKPRGKRKKV